MIVGHTFFNPNPGYALYGEKRLTLGIRICSISPDCDKRNVFSLLLKEIVEVAEKQGYHFRLDLPPSMSEEDYVKGMCLALGPFLG